MKQNKLALFAVHNVPYNWNPNRWVSNESSEYRITSTRHFCQQWVNKYLKKKNTSNNAKAFVHILINFFSCALTWFAWKFKYKIWAQLKKFSKMWTKALNKRCESEIAAQLKKFTKIWTKAFVLLEVVFLMYIFTHYWQKWLANVILYSPWRTDSFKTHLLGFQFYVTLWTE